MMKLEVQCPKKNCKGSVAQYVSSYPPSAGDITEGNTVGFCEVCDSMVGFHYSLEVDGIHLVDGEK